MPGLKMLLYGGGAVGVAVFALFTQTWVLLGTSLVALLVAYLLPGSYASVSPQGKAVLITGCDSGFGWHCAKRLDALGFQVFAGCLFSDGEGASKLTNECSDNLRVVKLDVTRDDQVADAVMYVRNNLVDNDLWAVVNNAGVASVSEIEWCPLSEYERIFSVNMIGMVRVTKAFLPDIRAARGRVVNVTSLSGRYTLTSFAAYSASKAAAISFTDGLRREMRKFAVNVCLIEPALYETAIAQSGPLLRACTNNWNNAPDEVRAAYGDAYFEAFIENFPDTMAKVIRKDINEIVDQMLHAVVANDPKARYLPTLFYVLRTAIVTSLPYYAIDGAMTKFLTPTESVSFKAKSD